jgi:uncharacterized membrane protein
VSDRAGIAPPGAYADEAGAYPAPPLSRMLLSVLALVGVLISAYLTLYKLHVIGEITCAVGSCEKVQNSPYAFFLGLPVAAWGLGAYVTLFVVAMMGLQPRWVAARWVALSLFGIAAVGVAFTGYLTYLEARVIHAWCQWCLGSAAIIVLVFLCSLPGLRYSR